MLLMEGTDMTFLIISSLTFLLTINNQYRRPGWSGSVPVPRESQVTQWQGGEGDSSAGRSYLSSAGTGGGGGGGGGDL